MAKFNKFTRFDNSFARSAKKMSIPNMLTNTNYGKDTKIVARKVSLCATDGSGCYGSKTLYTKEDVAAGDYLLEGGDDITTLPDVVIKEVKKLIRQGASDLEQNWANALELTNTAYKVAGLPLPNPSKKGAWSQYEDMIALAVQQLAATRGTGGKWRLTDTMFTEGKTRARFFVEIPNEDAVEMEADSLDDVIRTLTNQLRRLGIRLQIDTKTKDGAILKATRSTTDTSETFVIKVLQ